MDKRKRKLRGEQMNQAAIEIIEKDQVGYRLNLFKKILEGRIADLENTKQDQNNHRETKAFDNGVQTAYKLAAREIKYTMKIILREEGRRYDGTN